MPHIRHRVFLQAMGRQEQEGRGADACRGRVWDEYPQVELGT
jgi:hypothetical protein